MAIYDRFRVRSGRNPRKSGHRCALPNQYVDPLGGLAAYRTSIAVMTLRYPADEVTFYKVSKDVNTPKNDNPEIIAPLLNSKFFPDKIRTFSHFMCHT